MVDANNVPRKGELREPALLMAFVAGIVSLGLPKGLLSLPLQSWRGGGSENVKPMLDAYFGGAYRDLEGICQRVSNEVLAENAYALAASAYLKGSEANKKSQKLMPLLNSEPVIDALRRSHRTGTRIYVIGNNGEGKSILLGELAEKLVEDGLRVVGISFGLTDRFPFERPKNSDQLFIYVGARTSERGITLDRTSADVNRMVREIHISAERLEVFNAVVGALGFGERRYLVPKDLISSSDDDRARYAELQQLTDNTDENSKILEFTDTNKHVLGLMRQDSEGSITTFDELSSGEQQMLTLALKLVAYANSKTVILVDEPEISLHVSWQRAIPALLETVGSRLGCSIVVATHSPVIISSATHRYDQCFVARNHALTELSLRQRRSVETALFDAFHTYTANNRQVHERCAAIVAETIRALNAEPALKDEELLYVKVLREELSEMEHIIHSADSAQLAHVQEDLTLIAHTRAALDEITGIGRGSNR
jgi:ABC-type Mn2+/Zn2+ transport system ATPase subunit